MVVPRNHEPVLLICAMFSQDTSALDWAESHLVERYGQITERTSDQPFDQTRYYEREMGKQLVKRLIAFESLVDPGLLPAIKLAAIDLETRIKQAHEWPNQRPLNVDPGYLTEAKLVLATTKDRDHRIYLGQGIFGEITLYFQQHRWNASRWTYPDYQTEGVIDFLERCRTYLRKRYQSVR
ncbi:MAG TPA: DUF4416 family protein [Pirellulaceae bacterium]|nr:DUF4416 family protein [Pirellulaceae bacterium]HMO91119.1 DUF4416 family protein [Pirellulaceae bacterium]HMP70534.1 DUF4416 family protein [Pirellulaceae bacterium]